MNYWLHPEAQEDLREAAAFQREKAGTELSQSLLREFEHCVSLLRHHPALGAIWRYGRRRFVMRRFHYALIYTVVNDEIRILAVAHHSRRPGYWRTRKQRGLIVARMFNPSHPASMLRADACALAVEYLKAAMQELDYPLIKFHVF